MDDLAILDQENKLKKECVCLLVGDRGWGLRRKLGELLKEMNTVLLLY